MSESAHEDLMDIDMDTFYAEKNIRDMDQLFLSKDGAQHHPCLLLKRGLDTFPIFPYLKV